MNSSGDLIFDAIKNRNTLIKWKIAAVFFIVLTIAVISTTKLGSNYPLSPYIARVELQGEITDDKNFKETLDKIAKDHNIKAVIMHINSPGGGFFASEDLYHTIRKLSAQKPIVGVVEGMAASGGFLAAVATDYIVARYSSLTGSIGVIMSAYDVEELSQKIGINFYEIKTPKMKAEPSLFKKASPEAVAMLKEEVDQAYKFFAKLVSERRKIKLDTLLRISDGRVFNGQKALELKLIDKIGGEDEALSWLKSKAKIDKKLEVREYKIEDKNLHNFLQEFSSAIKVINGFAKKLQNNFELRS
jgi:protease-4